MLISYFNHFLKLTRVTIVTINIIYIYTHTADTDPDHNNINSNVVPKIVLKFIYLL